MRHHRMSSHEVEYHHEEQQHKRSDCTTAPPALPPARDIYATLAGTLAPPMDAEQYYQHLLQELSANHRTVQGWRQEKGDNSKGGPKKRVVGHGRS